MLLPAGSRWLAARSFGEEGQAQAPVCPVPAHALGPRQREAGSPAPGPVCVQGCGVPSALSRVTAGRAAAGCSPRGSRPGLVPHHRASVETWDHTADLRYSV